MLWYCAFTWHPGTTVRQVRERVVQQHDAGSNHPERLRGWYSLVGGGAGFLMVEAENPQEVTDFLTPYMDLMAWDVRAVTETNYDEAITRMRQSLQG